MPRCIFALKQRQAAAERKVLDRLLEQHHRNLPPMYFQEAQQRPNWTESQAVANTPCFLGAYGRWIGAL
jgi:hypothetical protein